MKKNIFITIEGGEGSGKTTQSALLKEYLQGKGFDVLLTREPGGTAVAEALRKLLLNPNSNLSPITELLLYEAARAQHIEEIIKPALAQGKVVLCDRFTDATFAYQGYGRKISLSFIKKLNDAVTEGLAPALTIYLDIQPNLGVGKAKILDKEAYGRLGDRIERESITFHNAVRKGYLDLAKEYPNRIKTIKTQKKPEYTQTVIRKYVDELLSKNV
ncbi:MAG: dTMP kinase [Elusimicrobia bacterium]|nr:dTMP kinase [Elusimicrobiota bacterium]